MAELKEQIDADQASRFLHEITQGWCDLPEKAMIELRCIAEHKTPHVSRFSPDAFGIEMAVEHAAAMTAREYNTYPVINPVRQSAPIKSATDKDIIAAYFFWADGDDEAAAAAIREFAGPKYTMAVTTGRVPSIRPHVYWRIEDGPITDLAEWSRIQKGIATTLHTDPTVVNPSRIMRLPGMINWPNARKRAKGRVPEIATLRTDYDDARAPVPFERMQRIFSSAVAKPVASQSFEIEPGGFETVDIAAKAARAMSGEEWHNNMISVVASMVGKGMPDEVIHAYTDTLTHPGYTIEQTRREVQTAIDGARAKGWTPPSPQTPPAPAYSAPEGAESDWPTLLTDFDASALPLRQWVYGYDYIREFVSVTASAGGVGKTSMITVEALAIITGRPLLNVQVKEQAKVWVLNLEDPLDEMKRRTFAAMKHYGVSPDAIRGKLFLDGEDTLAITLAIEGRDGVQVNDALMDAMRERITANNIGVVIIDPFVSTHMVNENSNPSIQTVIALLRTLARETGCAIMLVHHIRKGNGEDASVDSIRGAGSLIGAARAARVINRVTEKAAVELGVSPLEAKGLFRVDDGKANLAPPADAAVYRRMVGVEIENGEWVGVATPFDLPDEWAGIDEATANKILAAIALGPDGDPDTEDLYSPHKRAGDRWVGSVITGWPFTNMDHAKTEAQAKAILRTWMQNGMLEDVEFYAAAQRKTRPGVAVTSYVGEVK